MNAGHTVDSKINSYSVNASDGPEVLPPFSLLLNIRIPQVKDRRAFYLVISFYRARGFFSAYEGAVASPFYIKTYCCDLITVLQ